jgi:hypothetical protein
MVEMDTAARLVAFREALDGFMRGWVKEQR